MPEYTVVRRKINEMQTEQGRRIERDVQPFEKLKPLGDIPDNLLVEDFVQKENIAPLMSIISKQDFPQAQRSTIEKSIMTIATFAFCTDFKEAELPALTIGDLRQVTITELLMIPTIDPVSAHILKRLFPLPQPVNSSRE